MSEKDAFKTLVVRPARDEDGDPVGWLIARCWADYPGSYFDRHGEMAMLDRFASTYEAAEGQAWVVVEGERVVGCAAVAPAGDVGGAWELTKVYVDPTMRRAGVARLLCQTAQEFALARDGKLIILWTDTRFAAAHRFYEAQGFKPDGRTRALDDLSNSVEFYYAKRLV